MVPTRPSLKPRSFLDVEARFWDCSKTLVNQKVHILDLFLEELPMHTWLASGLMGRVIRSRYTVALVAVLAILSFALPVAVAQQGQAAQPTSQMAAVVAPQTDAPQEATPKNPAPAEATGEANLKLPDMTQVKFLNGVSGATLLEIGLVFCALGGLFGLIIYMQLKNAPVHRSMKEISELIYETCKTYLITQGKFVLILEAFMAV